MTALAASHDRVSNWLPIRLKVTRVLVQYVSWSLPSIQLTLAKAHLFSERKGIKIGVLAHLPIHVGEVIDGYLVLEVGVVISQSILRELR